MVTPAILFAVCIAVAGWMATIALVRRIRTHTIVRDALFILSWAPWIIAALGAPVFTGQIALKDAIGIGIALTGGITITTLMLLRRPAR